jgi:butyryl-CoA dehydrogenase/acyl-CoA dehydrogenase
MGVGYPEEHGGSGGGSLAFGVFIEELSRVSAGVSLTPLVSKLGVIPLVVAGDEDKAKRMTEGIARGELLMSYALTEAGAGSDAASMTARYERDGDSWVWTGRSASSPAPVFRTRTWSSRPRTRRSARRGCLPSSS